MKKYIIIKTGFLTFFSYKKTGLEKKCAKGKIEVLACSKPQATHNSANTSITDQYCNDAYFDSREFIFRICDNFAGKWNFPAIHKKRIANSGK